MEFIVYRKFTEKGNVSELTELLLRNGIEHIVTNERESLDSLYGQKIYDRVYFVKIREMDFAKADDVLRQFTLSKLADVRADHYLFNFSNEELIDVVKKSDEWSELDYLLAQKILRERGEPVDELRVKTLKEERVRDLAKPEANNQSWIIVGYATALLGGLLGIFIGHHLNSFRKTLPDGSRVYGFTHGDRKHGMLILLISVVMLIVSVVFLLLLIFSM